MSSLDYNGFFKQITANKLNSLTKNPFYLRYILEIYSENKKLPAKIDLMQNIINHLITIKDKQKFYNTDEINKIKIRTLPILKRISAAFLLSGKYVFEEEDFLTLIDNHIDSVNEELVKCTNIIDRDSNGNYCFKHNNFCEYLAACFFNEKYKSDLEGLLSIIALENKQNIKEHFLNTVSFLLLLDNTNDLANWIAKNCPENFGLFESDKFDKDTKFNILKNAIDNANNKAMYATYDYNSNISNLVCSEECIDFLLSIIQNSDSEISLYNALRVLQDINNTYGCEEKIKRTLFDFLNSGKPNENHCRDAIMVITYLGINSKDTTEFLLCKYALSESKEIRRGLYKYIHTNNLSDEFAKFLVDGLKIIPRNELANFSLISGIKNFHKKSSFTYLFEFLCSLQHINSNLNYYIRDIFNSEFIQGLAAAYLQDYDKTFLYTIIDISCVFGDRFHYRTNIFSDFFSKTNTENEAIEVYFNKYHDNAVIFETLSKNFSIYFIFLVEGYKTKKFVNNHNFLFNYCARSYNEDSNERLNLIDLIKKCRYDDADASIEYITYSDNYSQREVEKARLLVKYIFDFQEFKDDVINIAINNGSANNLTLKELSHLVHIENNYLDPQYCISNIIYSYISLGEEYTIEDLIEYIESNEFNSDFWIIKGVARFVAKHDDYANYLSTKQINLVEELCKKYITQYNPEKMIEYTSSGYIFQMIEIKYVLQITTRLNIRFDEKVLCKLLYIPNHLFPDSTDTGLPKYLINNLNQEIIESQIYYYIDNGMAHNIFGEECILYCKNNHIYNDKVIQLAVDLLSCKEHCRFVYYSWDYLIEANKSELILNLIKEKKINEKEFIDHLHKIDNCIDSKHLLEYANELFDVINECYINIKEQVITYSEAIDKYPIISTIYLEDDINYENLNRELISCLKRLIEYLIKNESEKHINMYLDNMLQIKTYSYLERDSCSPLVGYISSAKYLDKLITLLELIFHDDFILNEIDMLSSDIQKSILAIGRNDFDIVIDKLSVYKSDTDDKLKRFSYITIDTLTKEKDVSNHQEYSIEEISNFVFENH